MKDFLKIEQLGQTDCWLENISDKQELTLIGITYPGIPLIVCRYTVRHWQYPPHPAMTVCRLPQPQ
jgi:hypothetical protein